MLRRTLQAGIIDEYGLPALEEAVEQAKIKITTDYHDTNIHLTFPSIVLTDKVHAYIVGGDGKVAKRELRLPKKCELTGIVAVGDDLAVSYRDDKYQGHFHWLSDPGQQFDAPGHVYGGYGGTSNMATVLADGSVFLGRQAIRAGDKQMPYGGYYFHDHERFWQPNYEFDHATQTHRWKITEVDPQTGKAVRESVPAWFEEAEGGTVYWSACELMPAPVGAESSPLGAKDGMLGWKTVKRRDGSYYGQGIDGRRWDKPLIQGGSAAVPLGLLRQPGTDAYLPLTGDNRAGTYSLWDPSGTTTVGGSHAEGQAAVLPLAFWHFLKPRDEASSKQLRTITAEQCADLLKAVAEDRAPQRGGRRGGKDAAETPMTKLLTAVKSLLPAAPERMALGVAVVVAKAESVGAAFAELRDRSSADSQKETSSSALVINRKSDLAAAHWGMQMFHVYGDQGDVSVSGHLVAAAQFLKGESKGGDLPQTNYLWFSMLEDLPLRSWQTFWRATAAKMAQKSGGEAPWLEFLKHWHELGIGALPGQFDLMEALPEGAKKNNWGGYDVQVEGGASYTLQNGDDLFIVIENQAYFHGQGQYPYQILRYSTAKAPGNPPGYQVKNVRKVKAKYDPAEFAAFIAAAESCAELPLPTREELTKLADNLQASPAELGLIWMGGLNVDSYQHNFLPAELRGALGWKTTEASAARQALRNLNSTVLAHFYEAVVAAGCAAPFAADRGPVLRAIEKAWQAKMPKRLQLDAALQKRLSALGRTSRWYQINHEEVLALAADPAKNSLLQPREIEIKVKKEHNHGSLSLGAKAKNEPIVSGDVLRSIVQLVALVHAETAAGHPARAEMPALIKQAVKLLDHSSTLLDLRLVHIFDYSGKKKLPTPTEWLNKHVGKSKANAKDGTARADEGLLLGAALDGHHQVLVAFRPAKLKNQNDLARLQSILGIGVDDEEEPGGSVLPVLAAIKSSGFQKLAKAILAKEVPPGQWPQNPNHTAADVLKGIRKKLKLGDDAAVLYAQLLALPDPTTANVCAWNGWSAGQFKKAAAELLGRKLVLEATRARAGRSVFLPGEWSDLKAPWLPVETWKLAHLAELDFGSSESCPAGGPMVLRPFEELFAAAWKRVLDGDEPRYEDVKRKKKK